MRNTNKITNITKRAWTAKEDEILHLIVAKYLRNKQTLKEAYKRASAVLDRTYSACETRWQILRKNKERVDNFLQQVKEEEEESKRIKEKMNSLKELSQPTVEAIGNHNENNTQQDVGNRSRLAYMWSKKFGTFPGDFKDGIDFNKLQTLLAEQEEQKKKLINEEEIKKRNKELQKQRIETLKNDLKTLSETLDSEKEVDNKTLLTIGKFIIDLWFEQTINKQ